MCSKPKIPKAPKVIAIPEPPAAEDVATEVGASRGALRRQQNPGVLRALDIRMPPVYRIPSR